MSCQLCFLTCCLAIKCCNYILAAAGTQTWVCYVLVLHRHVVWNMISSSLPGRHPAEQIVTHNFPRVLSITVHCVQGVSRLSWLRGTSRVWQLRQP